jgi:hypothetical protein
MVVVKAEGLFECKVSSLFLIGVLEEEELPWFSKIT